MTAATGKEPVANLGESTGRGRQTLARTRENVRFFTVVLTILSAIGSCAPVLGAPDQQRRELRAGVPSCEDSVVSLSASNPEEIARVTVGDTERLLPGRVPPRYPFDPTLATSLTGETYLFWTPAHISPLQESGANRLVMMKWRDGRWSPPETIVEGGENKRYMPTALALSDGRIYLVWMEEVKGRFGYWGDAQVYGAVSASGRWSAPRRLSDAGPSEMDLEPPALLARPDGVVRVFWLDSREKHYMFNFHHPMENFSKVYLRAFDSDRSEPSQRVIRRGRYHATMLTPVLDAEGRDVEIVYFRERWNANGAWTTGKQGLYSVSESASGWSGPNALVPAPRAPERVERIGSVEAVRDLAGDLVLAYRANAISTEPETVFTSELRLLRRRPDGSMETHVLARGVDTPYRRSAIQLASQADGLLSIAYQAEGLRWEPKFDDWVEMSGVPIHFILTDGTRCLASKEITISSVDGLFDLKVDSCGRTHVAWVEDEGDDAVLKHMWIEAGHPSPVPAATPRHGLSRIAGYPQHECRSLGEPVENPKAE